jgi:N-acetylglucosaminyl-diphospho-decaprenol L-rhamnosyltransferase
MNDAPPSVAVVIVTYHSIGEIGACLSSLLADGSGRRVVVVDNASTDGTPTFVRERFPTVRLIPLDVNTGFAAGVNRGMREITDADFVFVVNPDSIVAPDAIDALIDYAAVNPRAGIVGPRVFDDPAQTSIQRSCRRFPSLTNAIFNRNSMLSRWFSGNRMTREYLYEDVTFNGPTPVDWVSGCAMLIRRSMVDAIGAFDEGFFFFLEDIDLCWRASRAGWQVVYHPGAHITHHIGRSSRHVPVRITIEKNRSFLRYYFKNLRRTPLTDPIVIGGSAIRVAVLVGQQWLRSLGRPTR